MKFYGCDTPGDDVVEAEAFKASTNAFFAPTGDGIPDRQPPAQSIQAATDVFYGV